MNNLILMDYANAKTHTNIDLDNLSASNISTIMIKILEGDEVATILFKNGRMVEIDSSDCKEKRYWDADYILYDEDCEIDHTGIFVNREDAYDAYYKIKELEDKERRRKDD